MNRKSSLALGMILGTLVGIITDNLALWLSLGIVFGSAASLKLSKNEEPTPEES